MMKQIGIILLFWIFVSINTMEAQVLSIIDMNVNPKSLSMGYVDAIPGNMAYAAFSNSAMMSFSEESISIMGTYGILCPNIIGMHQMGFSGSFRINPMVSLSGGVSSGVYKQVKLKNENGLAIRYYNPYEIQMKIGSSYSVNSNVALGVNCGYAQSHIVPDNIYNAFTCDLYSVVEILKMKVTLGIKNIDFMWDSDMDVHVARHSVASVGVLYNIYIADLHNINAVAQYNCRISGLMSMSAGLEYLYRNKISLRIGGRYAMSDTPSFLSVGSGLNLGAFEFNAAYVIPIAQIYSFGNSFVMSISYTL